MEPLPYGQQLVALHAMFQEAQAESKPNTTALHLIISLAESVKAAQRHQKCPAMNPKLEPKRKKR